MNRGKKKILLNLVLQISNEGVISLFWMCFYYRFKCEMQLK